ncbi:hypothetical protein HN385_03870 [archaeon]|jgi:hypothetical protein|nr:hypothetical protein [archaeon]MBT3450886.1 hypothetical protein [archaeon]MBT6869068.1 hypothetical protein [archaeon]MBT7193311.1 hypothetical protein [archaeon]MBT7380319.1 hypothetical protein [archaeon]
MAYRESNKDDLSELVIRGKITDNKTPKEELFDGFDYKSRIQEPLSYVVNPVQQSSDLEDDTDSITVELAQCGDLVAGYRGSCYSLRKSEEE